MRGETKFTVGTRYMDSKDEKIEKYVIADRTYTTDYDKMLPLIF